MTRLELKPVEMTPETMQKLEDLGLIIRLSPGHHDMPVERGETIGKTIYESGPSHGGHKLISVTVNRTKFSAFGSHPANEEFLMIGNPDTKPLYLVICLHMKAELAKRIPAKTISPSDFICLKIKYNDPEVSFFTMLAHVPHGEAAADSEGGAPSFYVTEPSDMGIELTDFGGYELTVAQQ